MVRSRRRGAGGAQAQVRRRASSQEAAMTEAGRPDPVVERPDPVLGRSEAEQRGLDVGPMTGSVGVFLFSFFVFLPDFHWRA